MKDSILSDAIRELLYQHDCVIIPDFGGLLLHYQPATVHPVTHLFSPPSKDLAFNRNLSVNDGLLANHIARKHQQSYDEVVSELSLWVQETRDALNATHQVSIEGIGTFLQDEENNLQFIAEKGTNFYKEAYGLPDFSSPAIIRNHTIKKEPLVTPLPPEPSQWQRFRRVAAIFFPAAILTGAVLLSFLNSQSDQKISYSGILVSCNRSTPSQQEKPLSQPVPMEKEESTEQPITPEEEKAPDTTLYIKEEQPETPPPPQEPTPVHTQTTPQHGDPSRDFNAKFKAPDTPGKRYYIIVGSYNTSHQADQRVEALRINHHFDAYVINKSKKGTFRVSIESYLHLETAQTRLETIRETINKEAWLLRK
ncbi:MAG: hypothetical protein CSA95_06785 [Bacteroidetes bacterium]|nr:MAG: hypothetical protein CSA95_06785 [Bacteroidota bacterium]PIE88499.1 MAG: hypothetical protein CSA04_01510 [Bacteroidota bacterium]